MKTKELEQTEQDRIARNWEMLKLNQFKTDDVKESKRSYGFRVLFIFCCILAIYFLSRRCW